MMLEFQKPFCVWTPLGYGWTIYVCKESHLANDIWTVALEKGGGIVHLRSDQIRALPNGTLDIVDEDKPEPEVVKKPQSVSYIIRSIRRLVRIVFRNQRENRGEASTST
jgi:hypothetical protein